MADFTDSDLLNAANSSSPNRADTIVEDDTPAVNGVFAPDLFPTESSMFEPEETVVRTTSLSSETLRKGSDATETVNGSDTVMRDHSATVEIRRPGKPLKPLEGGAERDTRHSSKNEGQHTDRRYLCYICHKLFTRRRSVRDHLNKIHGEKTWEPQKSLEVIVEPHSGEPIEPIQQIIAKGPQAGTGRSRSTKPKANSKSNNNGTQASSPDDDEEEIVKVETKDSEDRDDDMVVDTLDPLAEEDEGEESEKETEQESVAEKGDPSPLPAKLKKEESQRSNSRQSSMETASIIGRKRPLPVSKRGTAKAKSSTPAKRLKLSGSERSTPARSPSATPAQRGGSKLKKPLNLASPSSRGSSRQPSASPSPSIASAASSNDDGEVFCICRRGDNHTWMIACDGNCEEWYHGKCIGIKERDGELIDKFICSKCAKPDLITTWKRMCRRQDCRKPAKVFANPPSKYCSVECGRMFFVDLISRGDPGAKASRNGQFIEERPKEKKQRKKIKRTKTHRHLHGQDTPMMDSRPHTPAYSEDEPSEYETDSSADEVDLQNRGGALRAGEIKALLHQCKNIEAWRDLGKKPDTPPRDTEDVKLEFDEFETRRMASLRAEQALLTARESLFLAREKMLELIKTRSSIIADEVKKGNPKMKEVCGYDPRVAWSEAEFLKWYENGGKEVVATGKIGPPDEACDMADDESEKTTMKGGICIRNRCGKHGRQWQAQQIRELRFEQDLVNKRQETLSKLDHEIHSRAQIRALEKQHVVI